MYTIKITRESGDINTRESLHPSGAVYLFKKAVDYFTYEKPEKCLIEMVNENGHIFLSTETGK